MSFSIRYHGGGCCGMNQICGFPCQPNQELSAQEIQNYSQWYTNRNQYYGLGYRYQRPRESATDRLKFCIEFITKGYQDPRESLPIGDPGCTHGARSKGCIECVLTTSQMINWEATLLELGFKEVNQFVNSNSNNVCHVLHLVTGQ